MSGNAWIKFYPTLWLGGTLALTAAEKAVYITILALIYDRGGPIPNNPKMLARQCGLVPRQYTKAMQTLCEDGKLYIQNDGIFSKKCAEILQERSERSEKASASARLGQQKSKQIQRRGLANAVQSQSEGTALAMPTHSERSAIQEIRDKKASKLASQPIEMELVNELENDLRQAAGWHHDAPRLSHVQPIQDLIAKGLDLHRDVIPLVRQLASSVTSQTSWKYFVGPLSDILTYRAKEAEQRKACTEKPSPKADVSQVAVYLETPQFAAWEVHNGKRPWVFDIRPPGRLQIRKGFYAPSEWPPDHESTAPPSVNDA